MQTRVLGAPLSVTLVLLWASLSATACYPKRDLPPDQIDKLGKLEEVMDVQATLADPQFKKIGQDSYTDADWAAFADVGSRLQVTSKKTLQFSKGPSFDGYANEVGNQAKALESAAQAKDAKAASAALAGMKAACKSCHEKHR